MFYYIYNSGFGHIVFSGDNRQAERHKRAPQNTGIDPDALFRTRRQRSYVPFNERFSPQNAEKQICFRNTAHICRSVYNNSFSI